MINLRKGIEEVEVEEGGEEMGIIIKIEGMIDLIRIEVEEVEGDEVEEEEDEEIMIIKI